MFGSGAGQSGLTEKWLQECLALALMRGVGIKTVVQEQIDSLVEQQRIIECADCNSLQVYERPPCRLL